MGNNQVEIAAVSEVAQSSVDLANKLTPRQLEVLALLSEGLSNKLIARRLNISAGTVKVHVVHIHRALGVSSRLQAVVAVRKLGFDGKAQAAAGTMPAARVTPNLSAPVRLRFPAQDDASQPLLAVVMTKRLGAMVA